MTFKLTLSVAEKTPEAIYNALEEALEQASVNPHVALDALAPATNSDDWIKNPDPGSDISVVHKDHLEGSPVVAEVYSDDRKLTFDVDMRAYLASAEISILENLEAEEWSAGNASDDIAHTLERSGHPEMDEFFSYTGMSGQGFTVSADREASLKWLSDHRPALFEEMKLSGYFEDEEPTP